MGSLSLPLTAAEALSVKISCVGTAPLSDAIDRLIVFSHRRSTHTHTHIHTHAYTFEIDYNTKIKIIIFYRAHDLFDASFSTITHTPRVYAQDNATIAISRRHVHTHTDRCIYSYRWVRNDCPPQKITIHNNNYILRIEFPSIFLDYLVWSMVGMGIMDSVRRTISTRQTCILYYIHTRILSIRLRRSRPSRPRRVILSLFVYYYYYYFIYTQSEADLNS